MATRDRPTSRYAHQEDFARLADCFGRRELLRVLGVDRATMRRWRLGRARIPWAAYQLAFELSHYGRAERDARENFQRRCLGAQLGALRRRVVELEGLLVHQARMVRWSCANDPYTIPGDPRAAITATET